MQTYLIPYFLNSCSEDNLHRLALFIFGKDDTPPKEELDDKDHFKHRLIMMLSLFAKQNNKGRNDLNSNR